MERPSGSSSEKVTISARSSTEFNPSGPYDRRYLEETLGRKVRRAARAQQSLGFLMIDLDHFKRFNDTYGPVVLRDTGTGLVGKDLWLFCQPRI
jgi:GGDEF domain-containing protein